MKYESNILKRLIDTYGVIGNPRYLSEIIKEFIVRGKELYPQLFTYQADWLAHIDEFGLTPDYVVSYTGQQIYAPHTKERPVKRAILSGQTLVNLAQSTKSANLNGEYVFRDNFENLNFPCNMIKPSTTYTIVSNIIENSANFLYLEWNTISDECAFKEIIRTDGSLGIRKFKVTSKDDLSNASKSIRFFPNNKQENGTLTITFMILEGDYTNIDIPYFEGMQSVKMPVLTTSNEDGTKTNILTVNEDVELRGIENLRDELDCLTGEKVERVGEVVLDGSIDETWYIIRDSEAPAAYVEGYVSAYTYLDNFQVGTSTRLINDKGLPRLPYANTESEGLFYLNAYIGSSALILRIDESKVNNSIREYLQTNPITIQYQLKTESIKTVDLTIKDQNDFEVSQLSSFNGGTHFSASSQEGSLLPTIIVDVVTDLEETLNLCSMDGNTL